MAGADVMETSSISGTSLFGSYRHSIQSPIEDAPRSRPVSASLPAYTSPPGFKEDASTVAPAEHPSQPKTRPDSYIPIDHGPEVPANPTPRPTKGKGKKSSSMGKPALGNLPSSFDCIPPAPSDSPTRSKARPPDLPAPAPSESMKSPKWISIKETYPTLEPKGKEDVGKLLPTETSIKPSLDSPSTPAPPSLSSKAPSVLSNEVLKPQLGLPPIPPFERPKDILSTSHIAPMPKSHPPHDRRSELIALLRGFSKKISNHIQGTPFAFQLSSPCSTSSNLTEDVIAAFADFKLEILKTAPRLRPWETTFQPEAGVLQAMIEKVECDGTPGGQGNVLHVNEIMEFIHKSRAKDLPGSVPFTVKAGLIKESTKEWKDIAQRCSEEVERVVSTHLTSILDSHFGSSPNQALVRNVIGILEYELRKCRDEMNEKINFIYAAEQRIYTQNDKLYLEYRNKWAELYIMLLRQSRGGVAESLGRYDPKNTNRIPNWTNINSAITAMTNLGVTIVSSDLIKLLPQDPMEPGVQIMADVRAYFEVAYKRYTDVIPQQIDLSYLSGLDESLDLALSQFGVGLSMEECADLLS